MVNNTIISLCYVGNKLEKTTELCRFADYINGRFVPFAFDPNKDFFGEERDLLIGPNYEVIDATGDIGVFEWFSYINSENKWKTDVKKNNDVSWCEVLELDYVETPAMMIQMLKNGFQLQTPFDGKHDLVLVSKKDKAGLNAVLLRKNTLKVKDISIILNDSVLRVPVGVVDLKSATGSCQCRRSKFDARRYLRGMDGFVFKKNYVVKEPVEVVKDIIQGNAGYFDSEVLTRREKQLLRSVISRVTEPTIIDLVCDRLDCTVEEAHEYINAYIEAAKLKMDRQTALSVIEKLVESDVDAVMEMKKVVREEWLSENEKLITDKKKEIEHYTDVLGIAKETAEKEKERVQKEIHTQTSTYNGLKKENEELTASVDRLKKLKGDLEEEIRQRLIKAKEDLAGSMLDHALMMPEIQKQQIVSDAISSPSAFRISFQDEETEESTVYDCHDVAMTDWIRICGDEDMSAGLALLALAAFACNHSLLVAGEGAELIADMLSVSVCGHKPLKLHIRDDADPDELAEAVKSEDHQIICVINGLESGYRVARELMERFRDSRFIFTAMHGESLVMEPESLFSAFLPVFTDYFYNGRYVQELSTLDCSKELLSIEGSDAEKQAFKEARRIVGKWLKDDFFPPLFKARFARLVAAMMVLAKKLDLGNTVLQTTELEFLLAPWLKCMGKTELLKRIVEESSTLDEYKKNDLVRYIDKGGM